MAATKNQKTSPQSDISTSKKQDSISVERLAKYFDVTGRALAKVKLEPDVFVDPEKAGADFLDMAQRYFDDAKHFEKTGDMVNAFAALNYAHGWLDAGARLGFFDVDGDNVLFTVDKEHVDSIKRKSDSSVKLVDEEMVDLDISEDEE